MSFYGSTYFQLIDTFYKILVKNKGGTTVASAPTSPPEGWASQASGRKGILEFGTGNRWVYATQDTNNPNSYVFWHANAGGDNLTTQEFVGGQNAVTLPAGKTATILTPGSLIKAPQFKYDEAGHIAISDHVYYQMPISETEQAIEDLQAKVGNPTDGDTEDLFTKIYAANTDIEGVTETANKLRDELGTYSQVFPNTGAYKYTSSTDYYKDFFSTFGSMDKFRMALYEDEESSKTLIDGIVEFRTQALSDIKINADNIGVQSRLANKLADDVLTLEEEVANLKTKDTSTDEVIASLSATMAETAKNIRDEFKEADDLIKESIQSHTNTYNDRITNLEALVGSNKSSLEGQISDLNSIVTSNKSSCDTRMQAIEDNAVTLKGLIESNDKDIADLSLALSAYQSTNNTAVSGLSDQITALAEESATTAELNAISATVGQNTEAITALDGRITQAGKDTESAIGAANDRIDLLNSTVTTQGNTISNKADSSTVTTLETKVDNNKTAVDTALNTKAEKTVVEALQATVNEKANNDTVVELASTVAAKANQTELNTLSELVNTKASQESLNDLASAVSVKADVAAFEQYMGLTNEAIAKLEAENAELRGLIDALSARVEALEKTPETE